MAPDLKLLFRAIALLVLPLAIPSFAQNPLPTEWSKEINSTDGNWVLRRSNPSKQFKRFFAISVANLPGFFPESDNNPSSRNQEEIFYEQSSDFNLIYLDKRSERKNFLKTRPVLSGWSDFYHLGDILTNFPGLTNCTSASGNICYTPRLSQGYFSFEEMMWLRNDQSGAFASKVNQRVGDLNSQLVGEGYDLVWFVADEPDRGFDNWSWSPKMIREISTTVKNTAIPYKGLTYVDLGPVERSRFIWDYRIHGGMENPIPSCAAFCQFGYDKLSDMNGNLWDIDDSTLPPVATLKLNIETTASAYSTTADVIGVNSYSVFAHESNVPVVIDAIRSKASTAVIWPYFRGTRIDRDGNGNIVIPEIKTDDIQKLRHNIYTSIIHGATGAMFFNEIPGLSEVPPGDSRWNQLKAEYEKIKVVAKELKSNQDIFTAPTVGTPQLTGNVHWAVRRYSGKDYLIAVNFATDTLPAGAPGFTSTKVPPMGVLVTSNLKDQNIIGLFSDGQQFVDKNQIPVYNPSVSTVLDKNTASLSMSEIKFAVSGKFNNDNKDDLVLFYKQDPSTSHKIIILHSSGTTNQFSEFMDRWGRKEDDAVANMRIVIPQDAYWLNTPQTLDFNAIKFVIAADFSGDGKDDLAVFYKQHANSEHKIIVLFANNDGNGFIDSNGQTEIAENFPLNSHWLNTPSDNGRLFNFDNIKFVQAGDVTGDGKADLVIFYKELVAVNTYQQKVIVLQTNSTATGFTDKNNRTRYTSNFPFDSHWLNFGSAEYSFDATRFVTIGNFGSVVPHETVKDDLVLFYKQHTDVNQKILLLFSTGSGFVDKNGNAQGTQYFPLTSYWINASGSFHDFVGHVATGKVIERSINENIYDDLIFSYKQGADQHKIIVLHTNDAGTGFEDRLGRTASTITMPYDAFMIRTPMSLWNINQIPFMVPGDYNGDGKTDLIMLQDQTLQAGARSKQETDAGVEFNPEMGTLSIFPNPAHDNFEIKASSAIHKVEIFDAQGRMHQSYPVNNERTCSIEMSGKPKGLYLVRAFTQDKIFTGKLILE